MKKYFIAMILSSMLLSPMAMATGSYAGLSFGQVTIDDTETGNIGIVLGDIADNGFGFEFFYNFTVVDDDESVSGVDVEAETDIVSLFAVYKTPGDVYVKAKVGYALVSLKFDVDDEGSVSDTEKDFSAGIAAGMLIGDGALELSYYRFPEFKKYEGIDIDDGDGEVDMINLSYLWTF
jgi:hypothetical protein